MKKPASRADEGPIYMQLPPEAGGGVAKVNMDACHGHGVGARKGKEVGTISQRTGRPRKRHILDYSLDELRHLGWRPGGDVAFSHSQKQWFPFLPGYDSDSDDSYAPVEEFKGYLPGGRISVDAFYTGSPWGREATCDNSAGHANAASPGGKTKKKKQGKSLKTQAAAAFKTHDNGAFSSCTMSYKDMTGDASKPAVDEILADAMHHLCNFSDSSEDIRKRLFQNGTNVTLNAADPFGDGDQRPLLTEEHRQAHRDVWAAGADVADYFESGAASAFARACLCGDIRAVRRQLQGCTGDALMQLLERRETSARLSPIFFCLVGRRHLPASIAADDANYVSVAHELLEHGARPDARDFCGKTVVHYGAGGVATQLSLSIVDVCLLKATQLGLVSPPLIDMQDRTGALSFADVIMSGRVDVAKWLLARNASTDIADLDGISPANMVNPLFNREMAVAFSEAATTRVKLKSKEGRSCAFCGTEAGQMIHLLLCAGCRKEHYCSRECQKKAWKGHKAKCSKIASEGENPIKLQKPLKHNQSRELQRLSQWEIKLPPGKTYGDRFWIKVQVPPPGLWEPILIYDESRSVQIHYPSGRRKPTDPVTAPGHAEMAAKVRSEGALGAKGHFEACIDETGSISVYTSHMKMKTW